MKLISKGIRENANYFTLLGRFAHTFSSTEMLLRRMIRKMLGVSSEVANVIVGSPTAHAAMEKISALAKAQKHPELVKEFQFVSTQLGHINTNRNLILHHGTFRGDKPGEFLASNVLVARSPDSENTVRITAKILSDMTADLDKINAHLKVITARLKDPAAQPNPGQAARIRRTWLYKPPKQASRK